MASNKGRVYFALAGYHFNPDDVTRILELEPTSSDASGLRGSLEKPVLSLWEYSTETVDGDLAVLDVYKLADALLETLEPLKQKIIDVCKAQNLSPRIGVVLTLSVDKDDTEPEVGVGARMVRFMADIGAFINVEYKLSERI